MTKAETSTGTGLGASEIAALQRVVAPRVVEAQVLRHVATEGARVTRATAEARRNVMRGIHEIELVERVYEGGFLRDLDHTAEELRAISDKRNYSLPLDMSTFRSRFDTSAAVHAYFAPFVPFEAASSGNLPFPRITFPVTAAMQFEGDEVRLRSSIYGSSLVERSPLSPSFNSSVELPGLIDPRVISFAELERLEPGHAQNVEEVYYELRKEQRAKGANFATPIIVRVVVALPIGEDYVTEFVPDIQMGKDDKNKAWDPYVVSGGVRNDSSNLLHIDYSIVHSRVPVRDAQGKEAPIRVSLPQSGVPSPSPIPTPTHESNRFAIILLPYQKIEAPRPEPSKLIYHEYGRGGGQLLGGVMRGAIGDAQLEVGNGGFISARKNDKTMFGDRFVPVQNGRPVIYSIRAFTTRRTSSEKTE